MAENSEKVTLALLGQRLNQQDETLKEIKGLLVQQQERDERRHEALEGRMMEVERFGGLSQQEQERVDEQLSVLKGEQSELKKRMDALEKATIRLEGSMSSLMGVMRWAWITIGGAVTVWVVEQLLGLIGK